jgi:hypothetical protein
MNKTIENMDKLFPDEIFLMIFQYLPTLDLFRGFYGLNSRLNAIISDIPIKLNTLYDVETRQYILPNIYPPQVRILEVPYNGCTIPSISEFVNIRELIFLNEPTSNQLNDIQPIHLPYLKRLSISKISHGQSPAYMQMCETVFSDTFGTLKHLRLPYVQGNHVRRILRGSTSLTSLSIGCCTKHAFYCILEKLLNLEYFHVELGTPDVRSMVNQHINLKQLIIEAYDRNESGNANYMNMNELINLSRYLPNIEQTTISILYYGTPGDALDDLQRIFLSWKNLHSFDCFIKFAYHHFDTNFLDEIKNHYTLLQDSRAGAWYENRCTHCRIRKN